MVEIVLLMSVTTYLWAVQRLEDCEVKRIGALAWLRAAASTHG